MGILEALWSIIVSIHLMAWEGIFALPMLGLLMFLYLIFIDVMIALSPFILFSDFFQKKIEAIKDALSRLRERAEAKQLRRNAMGRLREVDELMPRMEECLRTQAKLLDIGNREYLMKRTWDGLLDSVRDIKDILRAFPDDVLAKHRQIDTIRLFMDRCGDAGIVDERNAAFKEYELAACDTILSDIDSKSLDAQQRDAVVTDEYSNLIIAGAGSGKTLTVVGKIKYLVERKGVRPEDILVTSFTRKSVLELAERIERAGIEGVSCRNFHQIGLERLGKVGVAEDWELKRCILDYLKKGILSHPDQMSAYIEFYGCYRHLPKAHEDYGSEGDRIKGLKAEDLTTLKGQLAIAGNHLETFQGERVKSVEELMIANFLFLHGVAYEYERNYSGDYGTEGRAYQPDFYLPEYDIWLEHFGVNECERCPQWPPIEEKKYIEGMQWKREVHKANGTRFIESYSWWNRGNELLDRLQELLEENGVELAADEEMLAGIYAGIGEDDRYLKSIGSLVETFLSLVKANDLEMGEVEERGQDAYRSDRYMRHRFELFIRFASPIMARYQQMLEEKDKVDFDDMINKAAALIAREGMPESYSHIIVDEYQDISKSRFGLIEAIREACDAKLMCVGDDWQSIYRFAGSDVSLFTDFGGYVGHHETMRIEQTYRNSQELVNIASAFVERNPFQIHKDMRSDEHTEMPVVIAMGHDMAEGLETALDDILYTTKGTGTVLVLGRHNFDIETAYPGFKNRETFEQGNMVLKRDRKSRDVALTYRGFDEITFMSVHRAKGLEADNVVVLNLVNRMYGFPNRVEDDPILHILLSDAENYPFAEERRLFYVAITRARCSAYLVSATPDAGSDPSPFIDEIMSYRSSHIGIFEIEGVDLRDPVLCPRCGTGRLVTRRDPRSGKSFLGCTNYPYCEKSYDHIEILEDRLRCPSCGGWMVRRERSFDGKPFFGCSNWPNCSATYDINEASQSASPGNSDDAAELDESFDAPMGFDEKNSSSLLSSIGMTMTEAAKMDLSVGDAILHERFGLGRITRIDEDILYVDFSNSRYRTKKLLRNHAPIMRASTRYSMGDMVIHIRFGKGVVERVDRDAVFVRFERDGQTKKLLVDYAPMSKIGC